jgi:hypothetical protein
MALVIPSTGKLLSLLALLFAISSIVISGYPLMAVAVILLAVAFLVSPS